MGTILLIDPGPKGQKNLHIPLALLHVAKPLDDNGYKVKILDTRIHDYRDVDLDKVLCVGITTMTSPVQISLGLEVARYIKEKRKDLPIIWGGTHPSILPKETIKNPYVDIVVRGEGEDTLLELVQKINTRQSWGSIEGITYKKDGKVISNPDRDLLNLNKVGNFPYHLIRREDYPTIGYAFDYISSKGCPHRCAFCCDLNNRRKIWRAKDPKTVVDELEFIVAEFNPERIVFVDANFFVSKRRVENICLLIRERGLNLKFQVSCRFDYFAKFEPSFVKLLKESGFDELVMGAESGSDRMLKFIQKDINTDQIIASVKTCEEHDIKPVISFVTGFPTETENDIDKTLDLYDKIMNVNPSTEVNGFFIFMPYPGCTLFDFIKREFNYTPAKSLNGWADVKWWEETGFPWITKKRSKKLQTIHLMVRYFFVQKLMRKWSFKHKKARAGNSIFLTFAMIFLISIFSFPAKIRWRRRFFGFPVEWKIWKMLLKRFAGWV